MKIVLKAVTKGTGKPKVSTPEEKLYRVLRTWDEGSLIDPKTCVRRIFSYYPELTGDLKKIVENALESFKEFGLCPGCNLNEISKDTDEVLVDFIHKVWGDVHKLKKPVRNRYNKSLLNE